MRNSPEILVSSNSTESSNEIFHLMTSAVIASAELEKQKGSAIDSKIIRKSIYFLKIAEFTLQLLPISVDDINATVKAGRDQGKNSLWQAVKLAQNNYRDDYLNPLVKICESYPLKDLNWLAAPVAGDDKGKSALIMLASALLKAVTTKNNKSVTKLVPILQWILKEIPLHKLGLVQGKQFNITSNSKEFFLLIADLSNKGHADLLEQLLKLFSQNQIERTTSIVVDTTPTIISRAISGDEKSAQTKRVKSKYEVTIGHTRQGTPPDPVRKNRQHINKNIHDAPSESSPREQQSASAISSRISPRVDNKNNPVDVLLDTLPRLDDDSLTKNRENYLSLIHNICNWDAYCLTAYACGQKIPVENFRLQSWLYLSLLHSRFENEKFQVVLENIIAIRNSLVKRRRYNAVYMIYDILNGDTIEKIVKTRNIRIRHRELPEELESFTKKLISKELTVNPAEYYKVLALFAEKKEECWREPFTLPLVFFSLVLDNLGEELSKRKNDLKSYLENPVPQSLDSEESSEISAEDQKKWIANTERKIAAIEEILKIMKTSLLTNAAIGKYSDFAEKIKHIPLIDQKNVDNEYVRESKNWALNKIYIDVLPQKELPKSSPPVKPRVEATAPSIIQDIRSDVSKLDIPLRAGTVQSRIDFFSKKSGDTTEKQGKSAAVLLTPGEKPPSTSLNEFGQKKS